MKRFLSLAALLALVSLNTGCGFMFHQYTGSKTLSNENVTRTIDNVNANYEVLGPVSAAAESNIVVGIVTDGTEGYGLLMEDARSRYGNEVTTILYPMSKYEYMGVLFPIYGKVETTHYGVAVKASDLSQESTTQVNTSGGSGGLVTGLLGL